MCSYTKIEWVAPAGGLRRGAGSGIGGCCSSGLGFAPKRNGCMPLRDGRILTVSSWPASPSPDRHGTCSQKAAAPGRQSCLCNACRLVEHVPAHTPNKKAGLAHPMRLHFGVLPNLTSLRQRYQWACLTNVALPCRRSGGRRQA